jgi:hypothetical protein
VADNYAMDAAQRRRPRSARAPAVGDAEARRVEAQLRTTNALETLDPNAWTVIKDLQWPGGRYGNVDHVVVGASGVYVIDTKTWNGDVTVYGGQLRYEGLTHDSVVAYLTEAAAAVALLTPGVPQRQIKPVLCVAGGEGIATNVGGLLICSPDTLPSVLESRVHTMSTHQITIASDQLRDHLHDRGLVKVAARAGQQEVKRVKRGPVTPMRGVPVIRIAIAVWFAATLVLAPHVFTDTYDTIHDKVEEQISKR